MQRIFRRGKSSQIRLLFAVIFSILLIVTDGRYPFSIIFRSYLDAAMSSLYYLSNIPNQFFEKIFIQWSNHQELISENRALNQELILRNSDMLLLTKIKQENTKLRALLGSPLYQGEHKIVTQVISILFDPYMDQVIIDKGSADGAYFGQPVISEKGVVGQLVSVSKHTSRVFLICNFSHTLPVQILRNDVQILLSGNGCDQDLQVEDLPVSADIRIGDVLVTSGLGGRFPEGYPVAVVSEVKLDTQRGYISSKAHSIEKLQGLRYLLLLWVKNHDNVLSLKPSEVGQIARGRLMYRKSRDFFTDGTENFFYKKFSSIRSINSFSYHPLPLKLGIKKEKGDG